MANFLDTEVTYPTYVPPLTAWLEHGPFATWLIRRLKPSKIVELGSHFGFSYFTMCEVVAGERLPTTCYAIDTWQGDEHTGSYDDNVYEAVCKENEKYSH